MKYFLYCVVALFIFSSVHAQAPTNGLVAYYPFNGNANDESGNGNNGVANGAALTTDRFGNANSAYSFDGVSSSVDISTRSNVTGNNERTISAWIKIKWDSYYGPNGIGYPIYNGGGNGDGNDFTFMVTVPTPDRISLFVRRYNQDMGSITVPYDEDEWNNIAVTYDGTNTNGIRFFLNGKLVGNRNEGSSTFNTVSVFPIIGKFTEQNNITYYHKGLLDDFRIYNRNFCDSEITRLYQSEAPPPTPDLPVKLTDGLVAYYPFNGNANDESASGNNGVVNGAALTTDRFGNNNSAFSFDGNATITATDNNLPLGNTPRSLSMWIYCSQRIPDINIGTPGLLFKYGPEGQDTKFYTFALWGNDMRLSNWSSPPDADYNYSHPVNEWFNIIVTLDADNYINYYINGLLSYKANFEVWNTGSNGNLTIGQYLTNAKMDDIRLYNRTLNKTEIKTLSGDYPGINWTGTAPTLDPEAADAFSYLVAKNIILTNQIPAAVNDTIRKDEIAKIIYRGLYAPNPDAASPVDDAPNPFLDLQPGISYYTREAKALSYLEYGDGISAFKRQFTHFKPRYALQRKYIIKAMMEGFNIKPYTAATAPVPGCWYDDVHQGDEMYYYILKARKLGFIKQQSSFRPDSTVTRKEAFLILYRILKYFESNTKQAPVLADYFIPSNIDCGNFGRTLGLSDANFNSYTKTSFAIAGLMPLTFAHSYNSAYTELPDSSFNIIEPLGKGWTHNYNCYLQKVADERDSTMRYVITWGDGTMNCFTKNEGVFTSETKGLYVTFTTADNENTFTYKTKSQVSYTFTKFVLSSRLLWVLTSVKDRNNNTLTLTWTPYPANIISPSQIRLFKVEDEGGRYLQLSYHDAAPSKITTVTAVTGDITRSIQFSYENGFTDLKTYTNPKGDSTVYGYEDSTDITKDHLLKQIKLPKGNIVDNTYEQRKVRSSQISGQYATNVNTRFNYSAANNSNFTEADISTTRNGTLLNSNIKQDQLGNVKNAVSPTGNLSLSYDDLLHPTKPSYFSNTINNLSAANNYDAMGNVTSVTKMGAGLTLKDSFTYNGFNDILTYINARGFTTAFNYNGNGNLTKIKDALNFETVMQVNGNGTVAKVINPEGIYTDFFYDPFGNTTQTKLMNVITNSIVYDGASRMVQKADPNNVITKIEYEKNDLVTRVITDPLGLNNTVSYGYDKNDNLDSITNPKGGKTLLTYNNYDQLVQYSFAGFNKTYAYNEDGTLNTFTSQNGHTFNYVYNTNGSLQSDGYANYEYDNEINLKAIKATVNNSAIAFEYDDLKRTKQVIYTDGSYSDAVQYEYDNNNNVTAILYPGGFKIGYQYDALDRLLRVYNSADNSNFAQYSYYNDGRLQTQTNGNGTQTIYHYDAYGRLDSIANLKSNNANIASYKFTMDNTGNHTSETANEPNAPVMLPIPTESIGYAHDNANRMLNRGSTNFTYDNNGNNTNASGQWNSSYTWDTKDNLLSSTAPVLNVTYDGLENRRLKNNTRYVLDILGGNNVLIERDLNGNPTAYYIHGLGMICRLDAAQINPAYYHYDYRGSTVAITNNSQTITHTYRYGAFGEMMGANETGFTNAYRYVGKYGVQFEDSSLYFMRARYYSPLKGRFLGEDPVSNVNLYEYAGSNPCARIDPQGNTFIENESTTVEGIELMISGQEAFISESESEYNVMREKRKNYANLIIKERAKGQETREWVVRLLQYDIQKLTESMKHSKMSMNDISVELQKWESIKYFV